MTTMYDASMQDFSQDSTMDTDVLPSASSDVDWLQVENMMEDSDSLKPPQQEIDMNHDDLQEYEMRDVDAEYGGDFEHVISEDPRLEPQDEEIPDASRAPSPSVLVAIPSQTHPFAGPERGSDEPSQRRSRGVEAAGKSIPSFQDPLARTSDAERSASDLSNPVEKGVLLGDAATAAVPDVQDNATISGESTTSSQIQSQQEQQEQEQKEHASEQSDHPDAPDISNHGQLEPYTGEAHEGRDNLKAQALEYHDNPESQAFEDHDDPEGQALEDQNNPEGQVLEDQNNPEGQVLDSEDQEGQAVEGHDDPEEQAIEDHVDLEGQAIEANLETQAAEPEDDGLLMDPPPSVLLFCAFDDSRFTLFNPHEISRTADDSADTAPEESHAATNDQNEQESDPKKEISEGRRTHSEIEPIGSENSFLLFRERFELYYEPLSLIFEALRSESDFNVDGRFDENVELVISAPELDLTLPEDNINSREVSLHDLNVLHNGCELIGPLSLRLDTVSPRFGTRYKAIRDEIFRVVSQQEEERQSLLDPGDEYFAVLPIHGSPENHHEDDAPLDQTRVEDQRPGTNTETVADYAESSESRLHLNEAIDHRPGASGSQENKQSKDADRSTNPTLEEYVSQSHVQDESEAQYTILEEVYAGEAVGDEEDGEGVYEDEDALYDGTEDLEQHLNDDSFGEQHQEVYLADDSSPFLDTLQASDALEDPENVSDDLPPFVIEDAPRSSGPQPRNVEAVTLQDAPGLTIPDILESQASITGTASQDFDPDTNGSSSAEQRTRSKSRTPRQSTHDNPAHDELIACEEASKDAKRPQLLLPMLNRVDTHVVSNASKRSYDELETNQPDDVDTLHDASTEAKRLRTD